MEKETAQAEKAFSKNLLGTLEKEIWNCSRDLNYTIEIILF